MRRATWFFERLIWIVGVLCAVSTRAASRCTLPFQLVEGEIKPIHVDTLVKVLVNYFRGVLMFYATQGPQTGVCHEFVKQFSADLLRKCGGEPVAFTIQ